MTLNIVRTKDTPLEFTQYLEELGYRFVDQNVDIELNNHFVLFLQLQSEYSGSLPPSKWGDFKWWVIGFKTWEEVDDHISSMACGGNGCDIMQLFCNNKNMSHLIAGRSFTTIHHPIIKTISKLLLVLLYHG